MTAINASAIIATLSSNTFVVKPFKCNGRLKMQDWKMRHQSAGWKFCTSPVNGFQESPETHLLAVETEFFLGVAGVA